MTIAPTVFLNFDNGFGLLKASLEPRVFGAKLRKLVLKWITWRRLWSGVLCLKRLQGSISAQLAPFGNGRGVDALTAEQRATLRRTSRIRVVFLDNAQALCSTAGRTFGWTNFGVDRVGVTSSPLWAGAIVLPPRPRTQNVRSHLSQVILAQRAG